MSVMAEGIVLRYIQFRLADSGCDRHHPTAQTLAQYENVGSDLFMLAGKTWHSLA